MPKTRIHTRRGRTLQGQLIRYNFLIVCIIAVFVSVCSYITASRRTIEVAKSSLRHHVESISYRYQLAYEEMRNIVLNCAERNTFRLGAMYGGRTAGGRKTGLDYAQLIKDYCAITEYGSYIVKLSVFDDRGNMVQTGSSFGSTQDWRSLLEGGWLEQESRKPMERYQLDLVPSPFFQQSGSVLPIVRSIAGGTPDSEAWAVLCLSPKLFEDVLSDTASGQETVVVTGTGERIAALGEAEENRADNDRMIAAIQATGEIQGIRECRIHGKRSLVAFQRYDPSGVMVYETMSLEELSDDRLMIIQTAAAMFTACLLVGLTLSVILTNQIKKPISRLVAHIGRIAAGDFARDPAIEGDDEIGQVGRVVNHMAEHIETLMSEKLETEKEKSNLEIKMLQAQINPHFLYNTLDSIRWIAVIQKNSGIVKMVTALSGLLKNMAKGFHEKVTLRKELEFLMDYVTIEKVKYVELFDLEIQVEEECLYDALVIKLTLQPLVENAIFNGIEPGSRHGLIRIRAWREASCLLLQVRDNGVGIAPEKLAGILNNTEKVTGSSMSGIGLPNVERRLKLNYGESYGLSIASQVGEFTEITARIPLEYEAVSDGSAGKEQRDVSSDDRGR